MKALLYKCIFLGTLAVTGVACGGDDGAGSQALGSEGVVDSPDNGAAEVPITDGLGICSSLDFRGVSWPKSYIQEDREAFALALNITGSFEGHSGWTNLSNNFDRQGFSMGLLNQNLGQGTIQPMLIIMRDHHIDVLKAAMTEDMLLSMLGMLKSWERSSSFAPMSHRDVEIERYPLSDEPLRLLSSGDVEKSYGILAEVRGSNSASVRWAKKTIYTSSNGKTFKPEWLKALKTIAGSPEYVSLQIQEAQYLHNRAHEYRERLNWSEQRAYLFLFDIAVQNGSLKDKHFNKFNRWLKKNPSATEEELMLEMLAIRVVDSNPKWQKDVRIRKTAVIKGVGFVHGEDRNLPLEYCYDPLNSYPAASLGNGGT